MQIETRPQISSSLLNSALDLYEGVAQLPPSKRRIFGNRLRAHALRVLEHVSTAATLGARNGGSHALHYARMSKAKLLAVVEAAWIEEQISDEQRIHLHWSMDHLEHEIELFLKPAQAPRSSPSKVVSTTRGTDGAPPIERAMTPEDLLDLSRLAERDSATSTAPETSIPAEPPHASALKRR